MCSSSEEELEFMRYEMLWDNAPVEEIKYFLKSKGYDQKHEQTPYAGLSTEIRNEFKKYFNLSWV
jgi:hypothetical protein